MVPFPNSSRRLPRTIRLLSWVIGGVILAIGLFLLAILTFDRPISHLAANEASAVSKLQHIIMLQNEYSAAHPNTGFACELPLLKSIGHQKYHDYSLEFLSTGVQSGYRFSLASCRPDASRAITRYQVTAVPVEQDKTGVRAFCANETGVIRYDLQGSATNCLASGHALQ